MISADLDPFGSSVNVLLGADASLDPRRSAIARPIPRHIACGDASRIEHRHRRAPCSTSQGRQGERQNDFEYRHLAEVTTPHTCRFRWPWCIVSKSSLHSAISTATEPVHDHATRRLQLRAASPYD